MGEVEVGGCVGGEVKEIETVCWEGLEGEDLCVWRGVGGWRVEGVGCICDDG